jgi:enoyl-[acyl-carrier protein] reductase II
VRLVKNHFFEQVNSAEQKGATEDELRELLGKGRAKKGMFEGDLENGELEIGQVSAQINQILPVHQIMTDIITDYRLAIIKIRDNDEFSF